MLVKNSKYYLDTFGLGFKGNGITEPLKITDRLIYFGYIENITLRYHRWDGPALIFYNNWHVKDDVYEWLFHDKTVACYDSHAYSGISRWRGNFYKWTIEQGIDITNLSETDVEIIKMVWS